jgi:hypothetical protein
LGDIAKNWRRTRDNTSAFGIQTDFTQLAASLRITRSIFWINSIPLLANRKTAFQPPLTGTPTFTTLAKLLQV